MAKLIDESGVTVFNGTGVGFGGGDRIEGASDPGGATGARALADAANATDGGAMFIRAGASIAGTVGAKTDVSGGAGDGNTSAGALLRLGGGQLLNTPGDALLQANALTVQAAELGFYGETPVVRPTVSASSLTLAADLLDALDALGLVDKTA